MDTATPCLVAQWAACRGEPGDPSPPAGGWIPLDSPTTAAAALRAGGTWSLDATPRDFDDEAWWFRAVFDAAPGASVLGLDGIATCAQVTLNGEPVASVTNMFVAYRCEVGHLLRPIGNELLIHCLPLNAKLKARKPRPRWRTPMITQQQLRGWRTTLLGRTPGWSPRAAAVGPWRDVWLANDEGLRAEDVRLRSGLDGTHGVVRCTIGRDTPAAAELCLRRDGREWSVAVEREATLRIEDAQRWWPHTHGEPALYEACLRIAGHDEIALPPVGFRTIEVESDATGFRVRVNGEAVFCRGAVWMPLDIVSLRASRAEYAQALEQCRTAGMNMLRVPGTTVYEDDAFYEACDRTGLLVWQDFMFANMDYPGDDPEFAASVETEVRQQLARWGSRPCIAVLCGNSEAEQQAAMWGAPRDAWEQPLFHATLPRLCHEGAPGVAYWPSSAHGGALPQEPASGTSSYYGVGAYRRPLEDARRSGLKFATECLAFANVPPPSTIARMPGGASVRPHHPAWKERTPRDLGAGWDFEDVRDHYLELLFQADARELRSTDPERYLALSRLATAEVMAAAYSEWRRPQSECGGALVLQSRDLVAGAGWGITDDAGGPKACWHALRRVWQPVTILITDEGLNGLHVHVINDANELLAASLTLRAWKGDSLVENAQHPVELAPRTARSVPAAAMLDHFIDLNWSHRFGPPPCDAVTCTLRGNDGRVLATAHHFPNRPSLSLPRELGLHANVLHRDSFGCEVAVTARSFAYGVHIEWDGMTAQDEHFHLPPGDEARVILRGTPAPQACGWVHAANASQPVPIAGAPA